MSQSDRELASTFVPGDIETPLYEKWMKAGYFTADAKSDKPPYTIVIPHRM
jgi:valyl-tRNA synthetase